MVDRLPSYDMDQLIHYMKQFIEDPGRNAHSLAANKTLKAMVLLLATSAPETMARLLKEATGIVMDARMKRKRERKVAAAMAPRKRSKGGGLEPDLGGISVSEGTSAAASDPVPGAEEGSLGPETDGLPSLTVVPIGQGGHTQDAEAKTTVETEEDRLSIAEQHVDIELGIVRKTPMIQARIIQECMALRCQLPRGMDDTLRKFKTGEQLNGLARFDFGMIQVELIRQLNNDLNMCNAVQAGGSSKENDWSPANLTQMFNMTCAAQGDSNNAGIAKIYGQIRLVRLIDEKSAKSPELAKKLRDRRSSLHDWFLQELATEIGPGVDEKARDRIQRKLTTFYVDGKKWLEVADAFGGEGVVFVVVISGKKRPSPWLSPCISLTCNVIRHWTFCCHSMAHISPRESEGHRPAYAAHQEVGGSNGRR